MNVSKSYDSSKRTWKTTPKRRKFRKAVETIYRKVAGDATTVVLHSDIPISTDSVGTDGRCSPVTISNFFRWGALKNEYVYCRINAMRIKCILSESNNVNQGCAVAVIPVNPLFQDAPSTAPTDMDSVLTNIGSVQCVKQAVNVGKWIKYPFVYVNEFSTNYLNDSNNACMAYAWWIKGADATTIYGTMTVEVSITFFYRRGVDTTY